MARKIVKTEEQYQEELKAHEAYCREYERQWGYRPRIPDPISADEANREANTLRPGPRRNKIENMWRDIQEIGMLLKGKNYGMRISSKILPTKKMSQ